MSNSKNEIHIGNDSNGNVILQDINNGKINLNKKEEKKKFGAILLVIIAIVFIIIAVVAYFYFKPKDATLRALTLVISTAIGFISAIFGIYNNAK